MAAAEVCRLCLKDEDLIWVFDKRLNCTNNLKEIVFTTTGVEILAKDRISQKICDKCHQVSFKMFQFRQQSQKNDKYLKDKYIENNKEHPVEEEPKREPDAKPAHKIHPSIKEIFKKNPQIKLPSVCLKTNIEPCVSLEMDAVENYFKKNNLNFQKYSQHALKWGKKIAKKKTSTKTVAKTVPEEIELNDKKNQTKFSNKNDPLQIPFEPVATTSRASSFSEKEKIHPIAIKINQGKDKSSYEIVNVNDRKSGEDSAKSSDDQSRSSTSKKRKHRKRKLSDSDFLPEPEVKKSSIIEAVGLVPKKTSSESGTLYVEKSVALFICNICNSVQYSEKGLKKHQEKHLKCQFCKAKFKTMDLKTNHIQSLCVIKNMMNNLPLIQLEKVEKNVTIREAYRTAFKDFPRIAEVECLKVTETLRDDKKTDASTKQSDIIEILSDDECDVKEEMPRSAVIPESVNVISTSNPIPVTATTTSTSVPSSSSAAPNVSLSTIPGISISSSVVKPDVNIKNNHLLEILDPKAGEIRTVKELLLRCKNIKLKEDSSTQTELPPSDSINVHQDKLSAKMKCLKHMLLSYKILIQMEEGSFNVEYSYEPVQKRQKKLDMWNDLVAEDVKYPNKTSAANSPASAPVDIPQPNFRIVSAVRNNHSSEIESHIGNSSSTSASTFPLPAPKNSVIVSPVYGVRDNIAPIIPQLSNLEVPQIPQNVQETSNIDVPRSLPNPIVSSSEASSPSLSMNPTNSYPLHNSALYSAGVIQMRLLDDVGPSTAPNSVASTVPSQAVSVPLAGTIRVKSVWELI